MSNAQLADRIAALRDAFLRELDGNRAELSALLARIENLATPGPPRERLLALTHSLAGRAGTFGFPQLSAAAADVHDLLETSDQRRREAALVLAGALAQVLDPQLQSR